MKRVLCVWLFLVVFPLSSNVARAAEKKERPPVDIRELLLGHLKDSYSWHFFTMGEKEIALPLPIIVRSKERGWFVFSSARLHEEEGYKGFTLSTEEKTAGKVVETNSMGETVRPFDISITKNVVALFFSCLLLMVIVLSLSRWYTKQEKEGNHNAVPGGIKGALE